MGRIPMDVGSPLRDICNNGECKNVNELATIVSHN